METDTIKADILNRIINKNNENGPDFLCQKTNILSLLENKLPPGKTVKVKGLSGRPDLNGQIGTVESYNREKGRFVVALQGRKKVSIKPANLEIVSSNRHIKPQ